MPLWSGPCYRYCRPPQTLDCWKCWDLFKTTLKSSFKLKEYIKRTDNDLSLQGIQIKQSPRVCLFVFQSSVIIVISNIFLKYKKSSKENNSCSPCSQIPAPTSETCWPWLVCPIEPSSASAWTSVARWASILMKPCVWHDGCCVFIHLLALN